MFGVIIQSLCEITVLAEKAGIPRHVFLESINDSVLGSMYTRYKTPVLTKLNFEQVTFTPKLLLKDMDLGLGAGKAHGVPMPSAAGLRRHRLCRPAQGNRGRCRPEPPAGGRRCQRWSEQLRPWPWQSAR